MKRRDFIRNTGKGIILPSFAGGIGAKTLGFSPLQSLLNLVTDTDHVLVLIYLNGGNDGLNTVVPLDQLSKLNQVRPHVVLPESSLLQLNNSTVGLHPSLTELKDLYDEDRLQVIQSVGYPNQNYSHFRSTDIWMSGSDSEELINSGWTGRYLNYEYPNYPAEYPNPEMPDPLAIEIGWNNSLLFQGPSSGMGLVISDPTSFYNLLSNEVDPAPETNAGERLEFVRLIAQQSQQYGQIVKEAADKVNNQLDYPEYYLAEQLKIVARLIAGGLKTRLYMVQMGGFDTHDNQVQNGDHTQGEHAELLKTLSKSVKAFVDDCDHLGVSDRVMGMTFSEFGRRIVSNASNGTDHGSAAPMFLFGNYVNSGVSGENPFIPPNAMYNDNLDMQFDFRQIYASVFEQWLCVPSEDLGSILLHDKDTIPITNGAPCIPTYVHEQNQNAGISYIDIAPNPIDQFARIDFRSSGEPLKIQLISPAGKALQTIASGNYPKGNHNINWHPKGIPSGNYFIRISSQNMIQTRKIVLIRP
jgi:uncharacterized protein (DUF1501 family)